MGKKRLDRLMGPKRPEQDPEQAAPKEWMPLVNKCDLDVAFEALGPYSHFHTDTLRGRTRSLQLRSKEAWKYFREANSRVSQFKKTDLNLLRFFFLKIYCFENSMTDESLPDGGNPARTKRCIKEILEFPIQGNWLASYYKRMTRAFYHLYRGEYSVVQKALLQLIEDNQDAIRDDKTALYLSLAVAQRALGDEEESDRSLENASLAIPTLENTYNMGLYASMLIALLRLWNRDGEAKEWDGFLMNLKIPPAGIETFRERAKRIFERSATLQRVFIF